MRRFKSGDRAHHLGSEAGFALVEVMVSAVLLIVLALATLKVVDQSASVSSTQRSRSIASNLAHADLNRMRQMTVDSANGLSQTGTQTVNGIQFTIQSSAVWTTDSGGVITCSSGTAGAQYLRTSSTVTWTGMGTTKPVVAESIVTPRVGEMDPTLGTLAVLVKNATGSPVPGVDVTANGVTQTTDGNGCTVFGRMPGVPTNITFYKTGYVDQNGNSTGVDNGVSVVGGQTTIEQVNYDVAATISPITLRSDVSPYPTVALSALPSQLQSVAVQHSTYYWTDNATLSRVNLYPWADGYGVYAGTCRGNDPTLYDSTFATTAPFNTVTPTNTSAFPLTTAGSTLPGTAYLHTMAWQIKNGSAATGHYRVYYDTTTSGSPMIRPSGETACSYNSGSQALNLTNGTITQSFRLPYGIYQVCFDNGKTNSSSRKYLKSYNFTTASSGTWKANPPAQTIDLTQAGGTSIDGATLQAGSSFTTVAC